MLQIALPLLVVALLIVWLPGWMRPSIPRVRLRTARVTTGPIEAAIMATGTVVPEVERVLSSPLDARVLRILVRPGAQLDVGSPVVELDTSESVLALEKVVKDLKVKENQQAQSRLTLEKSLVDLVGKIEVKTLDLQAAQARRPPASCGDGISIRARCEWRIDRGQMEQALLNALKNVVEAIAGSGTITLRVTSGSGLATLFTPFFSTKPHGQGIGLTLVGEILAGHGFDYTLERTDRDTTRFTVLMR